MERRLQTAINEFEQQKQVKETNSRTGCNNPKPNGRKPNWP